MVIDCKTISAMKRELIKEQVRGMGITPTLAVVLALEDPASQVYVRNKRKACEEVGYNFEMYSSVDAVNTLAMRDDVHGILVQLPLPHGIDANKVIANIPSEKDVDALTPTNMGKLVLGTQDFAPCTPTGIMTILDTVCGPVSGANCVVIGRSNIVGKPMAIMLTQQNATVTLCHSHTEDLVDITSKADILISAVGKAGFVTVNMVKKGAIVIDVGMNRDKSGKLCGDVCFDEVVDKVDAITPVPGGVGIMTVTSLLENTLNAAKLLKGEQHGKN